MQTHVWSTAAQCVSQTDGYYCRYVTTSISFYTNMYTNMFICHSKHTFQIEHQVQLGTLHLCDYPGMIHWQFINHVSLYLHLSDPLSRVLTDSFYIYKSFVWSLVSSHILNPVLLGSYILIYPGSVNLESFSKWLSMHSLAKHSITTAYCLGVFVPLLMCIAIGEHTPCTVYRPTWAIIMILPSFTPSNLAHRFLCTS